MDVVFYPYRENLRILLSFAWRMYKCNCKTKIRLKAQELRKNLGDKFQKKVVKGIKKNVGGKMDGFVKKVAENTNLRNETKKLIGLKMGQQFESLI